MKGIHIPSVQKTLGE